MQILISTVDRKDSVLDKCLESIKESGITPILIKGGKGSPLWEVEKNLKDIQRAAYGFYKCLTFNPNEDTLILEDDVILDKGWWFKFTELKKVIKLNRYMLSLILPFPELVSSTDVKLQTLQPIVYKATIAFDKKGNPTSTPILYSNTSAVFYTKDVLKTRLSEYIDRYAVHGQAMYDLALGHFMFRSQIPIFIMVPSLAKNVGEVSAMGHPEKRNHGKGYDDWGSYR